MWKKTGAHIGIPAIGERLLAVARRIPPGSVVADVGTDHGLLPVWLVKNGLVASAIGLEISPDPLLTARLNAQKYDIELDLRLGDGLAPLSPGEADVLVVSGLGGETIAEVLSRGVEVVRRSKTIIAQPMKDASQFARWASHSGLALRADDLIRDRSWIYRVLTFEAGSMFAPAAFSASETEVEYEVSHAMLSNDTELLLKYLTRRLRIRTQVHAALKDANVDVAQAREDDLRELKNVILELEEGAVTCKAPK